MRSPSSGWGWLWMQQATPSITGFQGLPLKCHPVTWFHVGTSPDHAPPSTNNLQPSREGQVDEWEEQELTRFPFMFNRRSIPSKVTQTENKIMRENNQFMHHWTVSSFKKLLFLIKCWGKCLDLPGLVQHLKPYHAFYLFICSLRSKGINLYIQYLRQSSKTEGSSNREGNSFWASWWHGPCSSQQGLKHLKLEVLGCWASSWRLA